MDDIYLISNSTGGRSILFCFYDFVCLLAIISLTLEMESPALTKTRSRRKGAIKQKIIIDDNSCSEDDDVPPRKRKLLKKTASDDFSPAK